MNYVDFTVVRLADPATRSSQLDQLALGHVLAAAYDADAMPLDGPYTAIFDELDIGVAIPRRTTIDGAWSPVATIERKEGRATIYGLGNDCEPRIDAIWRGSIVARTTIATAPIVDVTTSWPTPDGIDDAIAAANGGVLPSDTTALEAARRSRYLARLQAALGQPSAFTDDRLSTLLAVAGITSVSELFDHWTGSRPIGVAKIKFAPPMAPDRSLPKQLAVTAAILVRDAVAFSLASLLADCKLVRQVVGELGLHRPDDPSAIMVERVVVICLVPETIFDDVDWPGGNQTNTAAQNRLLRRTAAAKWLGREGIVLAATPKHP